MTKELKKVKYLSTTRADFNETLQSGPFTGQVTFSGINPSDCSFSIN